MFLCFMCFQCWRWYNIQITGWAPPPHFMTWLHVFRQSSPKLANKITLSTFEAIFSVTCHVLPQELNSYWLEFANIAWICNFLFMFFSHVPWQIRPAIGNVGALLAVKGGFVMCPFNMTHNTVFLLTLKATVNTKIQQSIMLQPCHTD